MVHVSEVPSVSKLNVHILSSNNLLIPIRRHTKVTSGTKCNEVQGGRELTDLWISHLWMKNIDRGMHYMHYKKKKIKNLIQNKWRICWICSTKVDDRQLKSPEVIMKDSGCYFWSSQFLPFTDNSILRGSKMIPKHISFQCNFISFSKLILVCVP